jgi:hypothetical protein
MNNNIYNSNPLERWDKRSIDDSIFYPPVKSLLHHKERLYTGPYNFMIKEAQKQEKMTIKIKGSKNRVHCQVVFPI